MKRIIALLLCFVFVFALTSCGTKTEEKVYGSDKKSSKSDSAQKTVDLTKLSSTMIYSEVSQMMNAPEKYVGNKIKMNGTYNLFYNDDQTKSYSACIVKDATACCQQGLEFVLKDGISYPEVDSEITVEGIFELYDEDGNQYCHIVDAELL